MASLNHGVSFSTVSIQLLIKNIGKRIHKGQRKSRLKRFRAGRRLLPSTKMAVDDAWA